MSKGYSGLFEGTLGAKKNFSEYPKTVHPGRQGKHIVGNNNYTVGRSVFNGSIAEAELLIKQYSSTGEKISNNKERIDFGSVFMYFCEEEKKVISVFCKNIDKTYGKSVKLCWKTGYIIANFDTCFEDEDDDTDEEYNSFVFKCTEQHGDTPVLISEDGFFIINYKNFPIDIFVDGNSINKLSGDANQ